MHGQLSNDVMRRLQIPGIISRFPDQVFLSFRKLMAQSENLVTGTNMRYQSNQISLRCLVEGPVLLTAP